MGYTTDFTGAFALNAPLRPEHLAYLAKFATVRKMKRDPEKTKLRPDPVREAAGLPVGEEGSYFVGESGFAGQDKGPDVIEDNPPGDRGYDKNYHNNPKPVWAQPGRWCQWEPNKGGAAIQWNGGEKFYHYIEWLQYLIDHFLTPWGYTLTGEVTWQGEEDDDHGLLRVVNSQIQTYSPAPSDLEELAAVALEKI